MNESMSNFIENQKTDLNIEHLVELAREAGVNDDKVDENWGKIDEILQSAEISKDSMAVKWASEYLADYVKNQTGEADLLDLSASLFEVGGKNTMPEADVEALVKLLDYKNEENPYPRFRAACALANAAEVSDKVVLVLREFQSDEDSEVASIATDYLNGIES